MSGLTLVCTAGCFTLAMTAGVRGVAAIPLYLASLLILPAWAVAVGLLRHTAVATFQQVSLLSPVSSLLSPLSSLVSSPLRTMEGVRTGLVCVCFPVRVRVSVRGGLRFAAGREG